MKLSKTQKRVLDSMQEEQWYCAYELRCSLSTLRALKKKGLIEIKDTGILGAFSQPRIVIKWRKLQNRS